MPRHSGFQGDGVSQYGTVNRLLMPLVSAVTEHETSLPHLTDPAELNQRAGRTSSEKL